MTVWRWVAWDCRRFTPFPHPQACGLSITGGPLWVVFWWNYICIPPSRTNLASLANLQNVWKYCCTPILHFFLKYTIWKPIVSHPFQNDVMAENWDLPAPYPFFLYSANPSDFKVDLAVCGTRIEKGQRTLAGAGEMSRESRWIGYWHNPSTMSLFHDFHDVENEIKWMFNERDIWYHPMFHMRRADLRAQGNVVFAKIVPCRLETNYKKATQQV